MTNLESSTSLPAPIPAQGPESVDACARPAPPFQVKSFGVASDATTQAYLLRRLLAKLGKFAQHIKNLEIRLRPSGWLGNAPQISCCLAVTLDGGAQLAVERFAFAPREAFDHATGATERLLRRTLQRLRHS